MRILIPVIVVVLFLSGCTHEAKLISSGPKVGTEQTAQNRSLLIGRWYGDMKAAGDGRYQWLNERKGDGTFTVRIRSSGNGRMIDQVEYGSWGVSANIYFTITSGFMSDGLPEPADPMDPTLYDAYEILSISGDSMTYRTLETGNTFTAHRVDESFQFPTD